MRVRLILGAVLAATTAMVAAEPGSLWEVAGGGPGNGKYSPLDEITPKNVAKLEMAWRYDTGEGFPGSEMQTNPIVIGTSLFAITPKQRLIALDATNGRLLWKFDPHNGEDYKGGSRNRGLASWSDGRRRTLFYAVGPRLFAIDAADGRPVAGFGSGGAIDLREGLGRDPKTISVSANSPGVVWKDLLIIGSALAEDLPAAPGDIRAYDVRTGALRWSFRTIPAAGEPGSETWPANARTSSGGANSWAGLTLDEARGLVFAPTGSAAFDFWGGDRPGNNLYANSLVALDAATGKRIWHFQTVRHDVWDRDLPAAPTLVRVKRDGKLIDAVAQITKTGFVYVFDRVTGRPLFPIGELPVKPSDVPGEWSAPSQPYPLAPPPFARQRLTEADLTRRTPEAHAAVASRLARLRHGALFEPPSLQGTIVYPGLDGGGEWGGAAFDPATRLLYVNANEMAWVVRLLARETPQQGNASAASLYQANCASCHGEDRTGSPPQVPALTDLGARLREAQVRKTIREGSARMPAFAELGEDAIGALAAFLLTGEDRHAAAGTVASNRLPFTHDGYNRFLDPDGYAAVAPPWGTLSAIDLDRGTIRWQVPLGEVPALAAKGMKGTGSENYGGPVVTAGGLVFIGATTLDRKLRAFDKKTGTLLWETLLPFSATATPAVYRAGGRQFVVIAAGGGKAGQPSGGSYLAFALPE
ncbi:outer membrane protein assembly factor BamB family protein [Sphingomonas parva]|nr:PQQ-binding-like beta-propeller repeat protein [Sphingomonas parva]